MVILRVLMHCEGCANAVKRACARIPGVATYTLDYPAQKVIVTGNVNRDKVLKRIMKTGKHAELEEPTIQVKKEEKLKQEVIKKANSPPKEELYPPLHFWKPGARRCTG